MAILNIYSDGACSGNQNETNTGGWGAVLEYGEHRLDISGGSPNTTNNRMELSAVIEALKVLKRDDVRIRVFTDSSYVSNAFREGWVANWQANGWKTAGKKPVENRDLWEELLSLTAKHEVRFFRVKGHVNLNSPNTDVTKHYEKFTAINGSGFSLDEFRHIIEMNNRADELANMGIYEARIRAPEDRF